MVYLLLFYFHSGYRRCLGPDTISEAAGYTGNSECWFINGSLWCYCLESKCNAGPHTNDRTHVIWVFVTSTIVTSMMVRLLTGD